MINLDFNMIGCLLTFLGGSYLFFRTLRNDIRNDIKKDIDRFEKRIEILDQKHEKHREFMENKWHTLLKEIHSIDKRIDLKLDKS